MTEAQHIVQKCSLNDAQLSLSEEMSNKTSIFLDPFIQI